MRSRLITLIHIKTQWSCKKVFISSDINKKVFLQLDVFCKELLQILVTNAARLQLIMKV